MSFAGKAGMVVLPTGSYGCVRIAVYVQVILVEVEV
jgi:hypothetical protein